MATNRERHAGPTIRRPGTTHASNQPEIITSRDNEWLKRFRASLRGTGPDEEEPIAVEGPKLVREALRSKLAAEALLVSESAERLMPEILRAAAESETGIPRYRILRTTDGLFASVSGTEAPQGVAALFRTRHWTLEDVLRGPATRDGAYSGAAPLVTVLADVQDPGNVGTIVRSAEAFGATGLIATRGTAEPWSPKAIRASAGSAFRLPMLRRMAVPVVIAQLKVMGVKLFAAVSRNTEPARNSESGDHDLRGAAAIFIGNEGSGLPEEIIRAVDATLAIAISETVESLNAGVAASVLLYHAAKQRAG